MRVFGLLLSALSAVLATGAHADEVETLRARLWVAREPLVRERLAESLALQTEDALEAFDLWLDLTRRAEMPERRQRAARRAAVLGLMLGQEGALRRIPEGIEVPELSYARALKEGGRARPPLAALDARSRLVIDAWFADPRGCAMPDGPVCEAIP